MSRVLTEGCQHSKAQRKLPVPNWLREQCASTHAHRCPQYSQPRLLQPIAAELTDTQGKSKQNTGINASAGQFSLHPSLSYHTRNDTRRVPSVISTVTASNLATVPCKSIDV